MGLPFWRPVELDSLFQSSSNLEGHWERVSYYCIPNLELLSQTSTPPALQDYILWDFAIDLHRIPNGSNVSEWLKLTLELLRQGESDSPPPKSPKLKIPIFFSLYTPSCNGGWGMRNSYSIGRNPSNHENAPVD